MLCNGVIHRNTTNTAYIYNTLAGFIDEETDHNTSKNLLTKPAEIGHQKRALGDRKDDEDYHQP